MLPRDKINGIQQMKERVQSNSKIIHKLSHYDQYQRELNKLKFQLKMKRRIYDDAEFKSINQRINFCEGFFKKEKYKMMREEADKILSDSRKLSVNIYNEMKDKLAISKKIRMKPTEHREKNDKKNENFKVNVKTEQSSLSDSRVVLQYELTPVVQKKLNKQMLRRKIKTTTDQKEQNERYVSQFQRKIKQELSKIQFIKDVDSSKSEDETVSEGEEENRYYRINRKPPELPPVMHYTPQRRVQKPRQSQRSNFTALTNITGNHRYTQMKNSLVKHRTNLKERQLREIAKVRDEDLDLVQKSRVLRNMISKYDYREKNRDDEALELMCQATLARADALLGI